MGSHAKVQSNHMDSDACVSYDFVSGPEPIRALTSAIERGLAGEAAFGPYWLDPEMWESTVAWLLAMGI